MDGKDTGMCSGNFGRKGAILVSTNGILDLLGSAITGSPYSFWMSRLHPQHCNQSSTSWDPHKIFQAYDSELLSDGNRGGAFGCIFLLKLLHCHIFGWEELKKRRDVLSYLKVLLAFAVSSWVCSPLADRCYSPSFTAHIFFYIICDSSPLDAGNQHEQDSWSFYSQATLSLAKEQIFNKYSEIVYLESVKM